MAVKRLDHIGVVVADLDAARDFFVLLGFVAGPAMHLDGDWIGAVIGLADVRTRMVALQQPGGGTWLELTAFEHPADAGGLQPAAANVLGLRHICVTVEDLDATLERVRAAGYDTVGSVVDYQGVYRLCYVRGPEAMLVELAEEL